MPIHLESFIQQIHHLSLDFPPTLLPRALTLDYHEIVGASYNLIFALPHFR